VTAENSGVGGGLAIDLVAASSGPYAIVNSTISGNQADGGNGGDGGGITATFPSSAEQTLALIHSTIADNDAAPGPPLDGDGFGGNLTVAGTDTGIPAISLRATIVSGGSGRTGQENCGPNFPGIVPYVSLGENLESTAPTQCILGAGGDQIGASPLLGPLALNGAPAGSPLTRGLLAGSPAIDSVPNGGSCPATDERGVSRPQGAACDAGAFEFEPAVPPANPGPPAPSPLVASKKPKCKKKKKKHSAQSAKKKKKKCKKKKKKA
jgi:hypothetical protein